MTSSFLSSSAHAGCDECVQAVFSRLRDARLALHRRAGHRGCSTRSPLHGWGSACESSGCADLVQEVLVRVARSLQRREAKSGATLVANHHGYLWRAAGAAVIDLEREAACRRGAPAKATTTDGTPGRVIEAMRERGEHWLVVAFGVVRVQALRGGGTWPWGELAEAKRATFGEEADVTRAALVDDLGRLRSVVVEVAGYAWLHEAILTPLTSGQVVSLDADDDASGHNRTVRESLAAEPQADEVVDAVFEAFCVQRAAGLATLPALRAAAQVVLHLSDDELDQARRTLREIAADYEAAWRSRRG